MKMSKENYKKLKWFYNYTLKNASDEEVEAIFAALAKASRKKLEEKK